MDITAKEIIERLIDENKISGKEACVLLEAINNKIVEYKTIYEHRPYNPWTPWYGYTTASDGCLNGNENSISTTDSNINFTK